MHFSKIILYSFLLFFSFLYQLRAEVPLSVSFGGGGRAGVSHISLFSNPASAGFIRRNRIFYSYSQTRAPQKGKNITLGIYDATNPRIKGGISYTTESRPQIFEGEEKFYNRRIIRALLAKRLFNNLFGGVGVSYVMDRSTAEEEKLLYTKLGLFYPLLPNIHTGLTLDNLFGQKEEVRNIGLGIRSAIGLLTMYTDISWPLKQLPERERNYSWSIATEVIVFAQLKLRRAWFQDIYKQTRGTSMGFSWEGPRANIEYASKEIKGNLTQKEHIVGINVEI